MPEYTHLNDIKVQGFVKSSAQGMLIGGVTDLPDASAAADCIVLYAGATTATHTKGKFYKSNGASWNLYEGNIVLDSTPTQNSTAPITSGAVYTGLAGKADAGSTNSALNNKVDKTTYNAKITALEGADSDMQGTLDGHSDSISTLQGEMADAKASISTLQSDKATVSEVSALRTSLSALEGTVDTLETAIEATFKVELAEAKADGTPNVATPLEKTIYLVPINDGVTNDVKAEYIYVSGAWEKIGTTAIGITVDATLSSSSTNPLQNKAIHSALEGKVDKVTGMGLSSNDYTTAEKTKLQGIASGAQVNVIESINVNGTAQSVSGSKAVNISFPTVVSGFENDAGYLTASGTIARATGDANGATIHTTYAKAEDVAADLAGKQATIKGAATTIADANLTASRALVSDANGKVAVSAVTSTELSYLDGVTSNIQDQLSGKLSTTGTAAKATADANGATIHTTYATTTALAGKMDNMTVDATPTGGSDNLVKSGGVFSAINTLSTAVSTLEGKVENLEGEVSTAKSYLTVTVTSATGNVTGRVITATPSEGSADTTATVGSGGSVTMTLNATSQYTVGCDAPEGYYAVPSQTITTATAGLVTNLTFTLVRKPVVNVVVTDTSNSGYQNGRTISVTGVESATLTTDSAGKTSYTFSKTGSVTFAMTNIPTDGDCDPVTVTLENDKTHEVAMEISFGFVVGVRVKLSDGTVEYTDDAVGFTAASGTNLGSWVGHKLLEGFKPVQRSSAGAFTDLNPNDLTQTASGGVSSITSTVADAFLEVPLTWMHLSKDSTYGYIKFSNKQVDSSYTANAFYGSDGALKNCFHYGLFFSTNKSNKAYCFGGGAPTGSVSLTDWITYSQSRGEFFDLTTGCMDTFLIAMFVVLYKSLNGQTALAKGYTGGSSVQNNTILTFTSNNYGMAGSTSSDTTRMAFLWIHDFWGNMYQWVGGMSSNSSYKCCIQVGQLCTASNVDMNSTGIGPSSSVSGYLSSVAFDNDAGFYPLAANGSETTLFADGGLVYASTFPVRGGSYDREGYAGPFCLYVHNGASGTYSYFGARLSYRGGRA